MVGVIVESTMPQAAQSPLTGRIILVGNTGAHVQGDADAVFSTDGGITWTSCGISGLNGPGQSPTGVATNGSGKWIIAQRGITFPAMYVSNDDGVTFTAYTPSGVLSAELLYYINNMWWVVDSDAEIATSIDGVNWTQLDVTGGTHTNDISNIAWNEACQVIMGPAYGVYGPSFTPTTMTVQMGGDVDSVNRSPDPIPVSVMVNFYPASTVTVDYATQDGTGTAGVDYTAVSGTLTWLQGDASPQEIDITLLGGNGPGIAQVLLSNPVGCEITGENPVSVGNINF